MPHLIQRNVASTPPPAARHARTPHSCPAVFAPGPRHAPAIQAEQEHRPPGEHRKPPTRCTSFMSVHRRSPIRADNQFRARSFGRKSFTSMVLTQSDHPVGHRRREQVGGPPAHSPIRRQGQPLMHIPLSAHALDRRTPARISKNTLSCAQDIRPSERLRRSICASRFNRKRLPSIAFLFFTARPSITRHGSIILAEQPRYGRPSRCLSHVTVFFLPLLFCCTAPMPAQTMSILPLPPLSRPCGHAP